MGSKPYHVGFKGDLEMIVGIDLGTTNSLAAIFKDGKAEIVPNRLGERLTPSVVAVDESGEILLGSAAKEYSEKYPERSASVFKRFMGSEKTYELGAHRFHPEDLSALILKSLKEDVEEYTGEEVTEAVISVPAYFDDKRRKATKIAGELAGLKVERIISEPTAAAITYGLYDKTENTRFLVFDLGGGTFDVSILELFDNILEVRAVAGDNYLGGENFTRVIEEAFCKENDLDIDELDREAKATLYSKAERAKITLGEEAEVTFSVPVKGEEKSLCITGKKYTKLCEELIERLRKPLQRSINDAHLKITDIDQVVLVGGSTRLPMVRDFIVKLFHKFPDITINPDEAVALGAATQAAMKERREEVKEIILTDVCAFTLGTEVAVETGEGSFESGHFSPIIERNTIIPASRTERFFTVRDGQDTIRINVYQGESRLTANNLLLGSLDISIPKNSVGAESVDVTYTYDINSILEVEVTVLSTGEKQRKIIKGKYNEMTDEEIKARMQELSYLKLAPKDKQENKSVMLRAEKMYEECTGDERVWLEQHIRAFEEALNLRDQAAIFETKKRLVEYMNEHSW